MHIHAGKYFRNLLESDGDQIVLTIFRLVWNQMDVCLVPDRSEDGECSLSSVEFGVIFGRFLCVYPVFDCSYTFPIDLEPNGTLFGIFLVGEV